MHGMVQQSRKELFNTLVIIMRAASPHAGLLCEKKFHGRSDTRAHISNHDGGQPYICPFSDYRFDRTRDIIVHMVV